MKKFLCFLCLLLASTMAAARPARPASSSASSISLVQAHSFWLEDYTHHHVLAQRAAERRLPPASLTKLMTGYVVFTAIKQGRLHLDQLVPISTHAARMPRSAMGLRPGSKVSVNALLHGMLVHSGNDAAVALAEAVAGSEAGFARMMNRQAARLGMRNSHFVDASGLNAAGHYSCAHDIGLLANALLRDYPRYYPIFSQRYYAYHGARLINHNHQLGEYGIDGIKTGYTPQARYCIAISAREHGRRLIAVIFGARNLRVRAADVKVLLRYGFAH
jgi:serine-type D-Ala-D-Ala carboxypeptidase (penicillin-binding protein 5/6)